MPEPLPLAGAGSPSSPIELYRHGFKTQVSGSSTTYSAAPNTLSAYLDSSKWTLSTPGYSGVFISYASPVTSGPSMDSALGFAVTPTGGASMTLTFQIKPGYRATITSFSFYNRSTAVDPLTDSTTGYRYWYMTINGVNVGGDTLNRYSVPLLSTGTRVLDNALSALTGTVTVTLHYYRSGNQTGTLRIDNFVLNGFVQQIPTGSMPLTSTEGKSYRYGFNGQERDSEIGEDSYGALYWEYDSRIGRRLNLDPKGTPALSYYTTFANNPIRFCDPLGDTARVEKDDQGNATGKLGQQFSFVKGDDISDDQFEKMKTNFLSNLNSQINGSSRKHNGKTVTLDTNDPLAPTVSVTFGLNGISRASMEQSSIYISWADMMSTSNVSLHEWLHTAGLMDRYIELHYYDGTKSLGISIDRRRFGTIPMYNLPIGYDLDYSADKNVMSVSGSQITNQQWEIVFAGYSERSTGCLGVVSYIYPRSVVISDAQKYGGRSAMQLSYTGKGAFSHYRPFLSRPLTDGQTELFNFIIHNVGGNVYHPKTGNIRALYDSNSKNQAELDSFQK
ncbi:MAG: hypothetical protein EOO06_10400 [Chitinophagaceae bacterium]|nr:MAG: hypothetical protein EOO06_10400 [Chitinophagaceae bacterium]